MPPLEEQRWIAEILDTIDETIQATERVIAKLWTVREGVLRGKLSALLDYPMAPVEHLGAHVSVGIVVRPTQYYVPDGVPVLRSANVREGQLDMTNLVYMSPKVPRLDGKDGSGSRRSRDRGGRAIQVQQQSCRQQFQRQIA